MKSDGLKRGLSSVDSSDYQMGETIMGMNLFYFILIGNILFVINDISSLWLWLLEHERLSFIYVPLVFSVLSGGPPNIPSTLFFSVLLNMNLGLHFS